MGEPTDAIEDSCYEYIVMEECRLSATHKTRAWIVRNRKSGAAIGRIHWYGAWRQYCFLPLDNTVFSRGCLYDIAGFIGKAMADWQSKRKSCPTE